MSDEIRLYIITDNPEVAARRLIGCRASSLPGWMKLVTDAAVVETLPHGCSAMPHFVGDKSRTFFLETVWHERRERGGIDYDAGKHLDRLKEWLLRREEAEQEIIADAIRDDRAKKQGEAA